VTERAANLVQNDQTKLNEFRARISEYRNDSISASDLIDAFFSLFDTSSAELGKLVKELADIFEVPGKRDALLKAWSDWKAINEDYPTLPGPAASSVAGVLGSGIGTNRVLKLKSSTAPSSKSAMSQQRSWGSAAARATGPSSSVAFPSLPTTNGGTPAPSGWLTLRPSTASASNSASNSNKPSPAPSRSQTPAVGKSEAFPALPAAKKPTSTVFSPGYSGSGVIRQGGSSTSASAWGAPVVSNGSTAAPAEETADVSGKGKGKGRQGKKQIVFQWG
jgi:E3 ubiquitin-protein ligase ZNF598